MFLIIALKSINDFIETSKKESILSVLKAINTLFSSNKELTKCCVYRIFNEIILSSDNTPLVNAELINELIVTLLIEIDYSFYRCSRVISKGLLENWPFREYQFKKQMQKSNRFLFL